MWRPFTADEATRVADALDALYAANSQAVLDGCPIRATCQKHPGLKQADDLVAKLAIMCGGVYMRGAAIAWMQCWFYPVGYIRLVVDQLVPLIERQARDLNEA